MSVTPEEKRARYLEYQRKYREVNKARKDEQQRLRYETKKVEILEQKRQYRQANKEKISEKNHERYKANKENYSEQKRKYREANREKVLEKDRKYQKANKDKRLQYRISKKHAIAEQDRRKNRRRSFAKEDGSSFALWHESLVKPWCTFAAIAKLTPDPGQTLAQLIHELSGYSMDVCEQIANPTVIEDSPALTPPAAPDLF